MMDIATARSILDDVECAGWVLLVRDAGWPAFYLQAVSQADTYYIKSRKWMLSQHMTKSEVVQTALKCVLTATEHEVRETFLYRGKAVFGPHFDVDALHSVAGELDVREDA